MSQFRPPPPVVFLVYANDRVDPARHLRNLKQEIDGIREALRPAEEAGLCEVIFEPNASAEQVFRVFCTQKYRNRIAVLHYAGHADDDHLLLETATGGHGAAGAAGLAEFLGLQRGLQLVFLNGCSTEAQIEGLLDTGCRAVIGTSREIDDEVAMGFAKRFYAGLASGQLGANGTGLQQAFDEAVAATKTERSAENPRGLYWGGIELSAATAERWPWTLELADEGAAVWNLARAAGDPLFGLPPLPDLDPPPSPFLGLHWFERSHAHVFFGRGAEIRRLYDAVTDPDGAPIVLFYGQSGVGKSSILDAGLLPRLEEGHQICYLRRDKDRGLLGTLKSAFGGDGGDLRAAWHAAEGGEQGRPLIVLDQVEEVYTRPNEDQPNELQDLTDTLKQLFAHREMRPKGHLILGFRKEWQPDITERLKERDLRWQQLFVEPIDRAGIVEAITGPVGSEALRREYRLEIDDGLAEEIADDLLADRGSPVAPTLQILLTKLWDQVEDHDRRRFTRDLYLNLKGEGILLGDFLDQQLGKIKETRPDVVKSGLALDVLAHHTTPKGFAAQCTEEALTERYSNNAERLPPLIAECKRRSLLADLPPIPDQPPQKGSRLAHDTLAPLVRERFEESVRPAQQARRILENRVSSWRKDNRGPVLDEEDLRIVEEGVMHMRDIDAGSKQNDEAHLIKVSRDARRKKRRNRWIARAMAFLLLASTAYGAFLYWDQRKEAVEQEAKATFRLDLFQVAVKADRNPMAVLDIGIRLFEDSLEQPGLPVAEAENTLRRILASAGGTALSGSADLETESSFVFSTDGRWLALIRESESGVQIDRAWEIGKWNNDPIYADKLIQLGIDTDLKSSTWRGLNKTGDGCAPDLVTNPGESNQGEWRLLDCDTSGRWYAQEKERTVIVGDRKSPIDCVLPQPLMTNYFSDLAGYVTGNPWDFDPKSRWFAFKHRDDTIRLWSLTKLCAEPIRLPGSGMRLITLLFSSDGRWLAGIGDSNAIHLWDMRDLTASPRMLRGHVSNEIYEIMSDPTGRWLLSWSRGESMRMWDLRDMIADPRIPPSSAIQSQLYQDASGQWVAGIDAGGRLKLWRRQYDPSSHVVLSESSEKIESIQLEPSGRWLAAITAARRVLVWDLQQPLEAPVPIKLERVARSIAFDNASRFLLITTGHESDEEEFWTPPEEIYVQTLEDLTAPPWQLAADRELSNEPVLHPRGEFVALRTRTNADADLEWQLWSISEESQKPDPLPFGEFSDSYPPPVFDMAGRLLAYGIVRNGKDEILIWTLGELSKPPRTICLNGDQFIHGISQLVFGPDGHWLAASSEGNAWLIDLRRTDECVNPLRQHADSFSSPSKFVFSRKGQWLASGSENIHVISNDVMVWNLSEPDPEPLLLQGHSEQVNDIAFHPTKDWLATASNDGTVKMWDISNPKAIPRDLRHDGLVWSLRFDAQGEWLSAVNEKGEIRIWALETNDLLEKARKLRLRVGDTMEPGSAEWDGE